jgi:hypothetical protein
MGVLTLILQALAVACFLIAAFWTPPNPPRVNLIALGLAFWAIVVLVAGYMRH